MNINKPKPPKSTGPKGDLDSRRWVIIAIRNMGAAEAQFPLPVTVNTQRIAFDRDEPVIAPAYYIDTLFNTVLPKYEEVSENDRRNGFTDQARLVEMRYPVDITEIPDEYQTVEGIIEFVKLINSDDCPMEFSELHNQLRLGQPSFNKHNYDWSNEVKEKLKPKKATRATANAG